MSVIPPAGPAWAGSLMGTSLAASLCVLHGLTWPGRVLLVIATAMFCAYSFGWLRHRNPAFAQAYLSPWGMVAMGVMALGSAWTATAGLLAPQLLSWLIGMSLGLLVCLWQLRRFHGPPTFMWGLALVAPMVAATSGGQLALVLPDPWGPLIWAVSLVGFFLSLAAGLPVFLRVYASHPRIPAEYAGTTWIPLGIIGQSTAAAHVLFEAPVAHVYGLSAFLLGGPLVVFAGWSFWRAVLQWPDYTPGWWGATFPAGTLSLGAAYLGWEEVSTVFFALLLVHWILCVARFFTHRVALA